MKHDPGHSRVGGLHMINDTPKKERKARTPKAEKVSTPEPVQKKKGGAFMPREEHYPEGFSFEEYERVTSQWTPADWYYALGARHCLLGIVYAMLQGRVCKEEAVKQYDTRTRLLLAYDDPMRPMTQGPPVRDLDIIEGTALYKKLDYFLYEASQRFNVPDITSKGLEKLKLGVYDNPNDRVNLEIRAMQSDSIIVLEHVVNLHEFTNHCGASVFPENHGQVIPGVFTALVDLSHSNDVLVEKFEEWLENTRAVTGINPKQPAMLNKKTITKFVVSQWIKYKVLPFIDLFIFNIIYRFSDPKLFNIARQEQVLLDINELAGNPLNAIVDHVQTINSAIKSSVEPPHSVDFSALVRPKPDLSKYLSTRAWYKLLKAENEEKKESRWGARYKPFINILGDTDLLRALQAQGDQPFTNATTGDPKT